jgi:hypothetical protein
MLRSTATDDAKGTVKRVLLNGIEIGEYVATGDHERDTIAARQVLIDKGVYKPVSPLQAVYHQAFAFCAASSDLYAKHLSRSPFNGRAVAPFVVNAAFSIELYLKTLHAVDGPRARGHKLVALYDDLPARHRAELDKAAEQYASEYKIAAPVQYRARLAQLNDAFEQWRYVHESHALAAIHIPETIFVMRVLHEVCGAAVKSKE